jgi:hypothetical protein
MQHSLFVKCGNFADSENSDKESTITFQEPKETQRRTAMSEIGVLLFKHIKNKAKIDGAVVMALLLTTTNGLTTIAPNLALEG